MSGYKELEEYGIIGNLETCALIGADGSVDWLCFPYLESPSVFGGLLDNVHGGFFSITPVAKYKSIQSYVKFTNILQTTFNTSLGIAKITDFMPVKHVEDPKFLRALFRKIDWIEKGRIELEVRFAPKFDYGRGIPRLEKTDGGIIAKWKDQTLFLQSPVPLEIKDGEAIGYVREALGKTLWFVMQYDHSAPFDLNDCDQMLKRTEKFWGDWSHTCEGGSCVFNAPWHDLIIRSGLILKLLANPDTGSIAAAPTASLPEKIGGVRNWDYRYAWVRDSAFTAQALYHLGHIREAKDYRRWIKEIVWKSKPQDIKVMYNLHGEKDLSEKIIDNLSGYEQSGPVRIGNAASGQTQLDIYGELLNTIYDTTRYGEEVLPGNWKMIEGMVDYVCEVWKTKDYGIWEVRSGPEDFVYSKLMCWVAVDRGIKIAKLNGFEAPLDNWKKTQAEIKEAIIEKGFNKKIGSFVRSFGSEDIDATALLIPVMGFLPFTDPMVQSTINMVLKRLVSKYGLVNRYTGADGLPGGEGSFILCSFWLVNALSLSGRKEEAERHFMQVLKYISPLGLISEEVDPATGRLVGNFPQAFSHIGLINAAIHIGIAKGEEHKGPRPLGESGTA